LANGRNPHGRPAARAYNDAMMPVDSVIAALAPEIRAHVFNVAENLQLVADLGYGDVALFVPQADGTLAVAADARPMTAAAVMPHSRVGETVLREEESEAYAAVEGAAGASNVHVRPWRGTWLNVTVYPIGPGARPCAVVVRYITQTVAEAPGKMEVSFMRLTERVLERLEMGPLREIVTGASYATTRTAGDGVLEIARYGTVEYASPNAVNIMRLAGAEGSIVGGPLSALPGGTTAIGPVLGGVGARETTVEVGGRALRYRTIGLESGALVLVEDVTEAIRREQEIRVKEATVREVHHRVKNNLQTVASLLRIQARRSASADARHALEEAVERVSSMAVVHEMLAESTEDAIDVASAVRTVVEMVGRGLMAPGAEIELLVEGETGLLPAPVATSLALVAVELVHNAIEHGIGPGGAGSVWVTMERLPGGVALGVRDSGRGLPDGFSLDSSANLGLAIVRTIVEDDLRGTLTFESDRAGTRISVAVPLSETTE